MPILSNKAITEILYWVTRKKWLIISFILSISLFYFPSPEGLSSEGHRTLIIVIIVLILIISESIPLPAVAILILIMQVILGVDTAEGVASTFMSDAVFFIMGSLMLAVSIVSQGLDKRLALGIINITGNNIFLDDSDGRFYGNGDLNIFFTGKDIIFFTRFLFLISKGSIILLGVLFFS